MFMMLTRPEELERCRVRMRSEPLVGGSVAESKEFLTGKLVVLLLLA